MTAVLDVLSAADRKLMRRSKQPAWTEPMKALLTHDYFSDDDWIFEPKLDGERCIAFVKDHSARLMSRNQKRIDFSYPEIVEALGRHAHADVVLDGEVVAFDGDVPSFSRLQHRMHVRDAEKARRTGVAVFYYVFDVLHVDGHDVTKLPLTTRKKLLKKAVSFRSPLRFVGHRRGDGEAYLEEICRQQGWEGLIAKRAVGSYQHSRSKDWLKFKCANEQEFVIGGYTDPQGSRTSLGALLIGYFEDGKLRYAGKVGTGFSQEILTMLENELRAREIDEPPFVDRGIERRRAHWVKPELVAQVGFGEWTGDGRLRHPRFLGLRRDKPARKVFREDRT